MNPPDPTRAAAPKSLVATSLVLYGLLYAPILTVVVYSFNRSAHGVEWHGFTTEWYVRVWRDTQAFDAIQNTLLLAGVSTLISTVMGTLLGYGLSRGPFRSERWILGFIRVPVMIPDIALAAALLLTFSWFRQVIPWLAPGMPAMIAGHVTFQIPFVAVIVRARLHGMDPDLERAAADLGANPAQVFWHVTVPLAAPGIAAGALLAFTLSLDDFMVSFFTSGPGSTTLPILIYASVKRGATPAIHALSTLMILLSLAATLALAILYRRLDTHQNKAEGNL